MSIKFQTEGELAAIAAVGWADNPSAMIAGSPTTAERLNF